MKYLSIYRFVKHYIWIIRGVTIEGKNKKQPLHKIDKSLIYQKDGRKFKGEIDEWRY